MHPSTARRKIAALRSLAKWRLREGRPRLHTVIRHSKIDTTLVYAKVQAPENITERLGIE